MLWYDILHGQGSGKETHGECGSCRITSGLCGESFRVPILRSILIILITVTNALCDIGRQNRVFSTSEEIIRPRIII